MTEAPRSQQLRLREHQLFLILTIVIGVTAGLSAVLFSVAIDQVSRRLFGLSPSAVRLFLVPPLVSLITGVLLARVFPDVRGSGVPQTETAYRLAGGVIPGRVPLGKFVTGVLCIASGHSMGREGPSVQIGAGIASVAGRWLKLSPERVRDLVPVGAAGALAAAFNTPVAAVLFALEEIIGDLNATLLGSTVVASVAAVVVERSILGNEPLFHVPTYRLVHPMELVAYAGLGIVGGALSLVFCKGLLTVRRFFQGLPAATRIVQPAIGGLIIGAMLLYSPAIMGVGYEYVDQALNGGLLLRTMAVLCLLKLVATIVSYSSGNAGGIFAPSLYIGAMAGGAVGAIVHRWSPVATADAGAYALVGMGTLFAGIIRAPMTSVFMIFEITQDYQILVPLMVANLLSFMISRRFQPVPVYHALLHQDGIHLPAPGAHITRATRTARQVMTVDDTSVMPPNLTIADAWLRAQSSDHPVYLVGAPSRVVGAVTRSDLGGLYDTEKATEPIGTIAQQSFVHVHPDHTMDVVFERLEESGGLLPVVSRADAHRLEGVITMESLTRRRRRHTSQQGSSGSS